MEIWRLGNKSDMHAQACTPSCTHTQMVSRGLPLGRERGLMWRMRSFLLELSGTFSLFWRWWWRGVKPFFSSPSASTFSPHLLACQAPPSSTQRARHLPVYLMPFQQKVKADKFIAAASPNLRTRLRRSQRLHVSSQRSGGSVSLK